MPLTQQAEKFLTVVRQHSNTQRWLTRSEIAQIVGKKRLNPYEVAVIDMLAEQGLIEKVREETFGAIGFQWKYRSRLEVNRAELLSGERGNRT